MPYGASNLNTTGNFNGVNPRPYVTTRRLCQPAVGLQHDLLLHRSRCVSDRGPEPDRSGDQLHPRHSGRAPDEHDQFFAQAQVINLFNQFQLCGCGGTVFQNGGATTQTRIDTTVSTSVATPTRYAPFNPFHDDASAGRELELRPEFRHGVEPIGLHVATAVPGHLRDPVLTQRRSVDRKGRGRKARPFFFTTTPPEPPPKLLLRFDRYTQRPALAPPRRPCLRRLSKGQKKPGTNGSIRASFSTQRAIHCWKALMRMRQVGLAVAVMTLLLARLVGAQSTTRHHFRPRHRPPGTRAARGDGRRRVTSPSRYPDDDHIGDR